MPEAPFCLLFAPSPAGTVETFAINPAADLCVTVFIAGAAPGMFTGSVVIALGSVGLSRASRGVLKVLL